MAEEEKPAEASAETGKPKRPIKYVNMDIEGIYADTFVLLASTDKTVFNLYFCQSHLPSTFTRDPNISSETRAEPQPLAAVARLILTQKTFEHLLRAMSQNMTIPTQKANEEKA
jgi:hypothetical protein